MKTLIIRMQDGDGLWYYDGQTPWHGGIRKARHFAARSGAERKAEELNRQTPRAWNIMVIESDIEIDYTDYEPTPDYGQTARGAAHNRVRTRMQNARKFKLVGKNEHGELYMNTLKGRVSFGRALDLCNQSRDAGDTFSMVFDENDDYVVGVLPWEQTPEQDEAMLQEARAFLRDW